MKNKWIDWNATAKAKKQYGSEAVVVLQETKSGLQQVLFENTGGEFKYEKQFSGGSDEVVDDTIEDVEDYQKVVDDGAKKYWNGTMDGLDDFVNKFKNAKAIIDLSFGKFVNGKGSFMKSLAKTTGLKFAYEFEKMLKTSIVGFNDLVSLSGLKQASIELKTDLKELGIPMSDFHSKKGLQNALKVLNRKGEIKQLQKLIKFNLDFDKKGGKFLINSLKQKDPRQLTRMLQRKGLGNKEAKDLVLKAFVNGKRKKNS